MPKYTAAIYYRGTEVEGKDNTVLMLYVLYLAAGVLYIIAFMVSSCCNQQAPAEEELVVDSDDDGIDTSEDEDEPEGHMATME